ncbi:nickel ABC transporter ATP-binding protein NikE (plasmid) [Microvirga sp. RSM25]|uniref:nickel ABC transporter ATP-binding protein NikE n=1 Tax=Microvirga sp. RSM25 TaxID=3273802 RepID=UPI00384AEEDA
MSTSPEPLAEIRNLSVSFESNGQTVQAVKSVSLHVHRGEILGIVGESGSGKSVTVRSLVGLAGRGAKVAANRLMVKGRDLLPLGDRDWRAIRGREVGLVLQDALVSLDPLRTVGAEVVEALRAHGDVRRTMAQRLAIELLRDVGVSDPELRARQYSHELSGGLRQRTLIASAIAANPDLILADEPTTALDVGVQAQILALLKSRVKSGAGMILISHDIGVVGQIADRVIVMKDGEVVEAGATTEILGRPSHPYTRRLLRAIPSERSRGFRLSLPLELEAAPLEAGKLPERRVSAGEVVLKVSGIDKSYVNADGTRRRVVNDVSFDIRRGETVGLVGESGSGKSTLARLIMGLSRPDQGEILLEGKRWSGVPEAERRSRRSDIQIVTQDTLGVFDPRYSVRSSLNEALEETRDLTPEHRVAEIANLLDWVGLPKKHLDKPLRELSGGERQRVAIARALATKPRLLVCDEPVSALDVSIQAQILDLLWELQARTHIAYLFISHDLGVVDHISNRVLIMLHGGIVECETAQGLERVA